MRGATTEQMNRLRAQMWISGSELALAVSCLECTSWRPELKTAARVQFFYHLRDESGKIAAKLHPFAGFGLKQARKM
ncbi:hypothetical protein J27TS7_50670 [Paenibacillus dendritiformis]|uniref:hypothetical protein n=1 Tax=Paenibacillus dendritiformis TaxID=130049 RepID=UPI001B248978|nr:hypothetical protein [Paenibacillus dendritiformis]GIO75553.1 hypothetical protein J27TS7_50670 [Paenibacillus dendritiformis]